MATRPASRLFLDLRSRHFAWDEQLVWSPGRLWVRLSDTFRSGMYAVYRGFYCEDDAALTRGLREVGLTPPNLSPSASARLREILEGHFGQGRSAPVAFRVAHFQSSFDTLFRFLLEHQVKLPADFLFLGVYLATLYLTLEELEEPLDVASAYAAATHEIAATHPRS